jgi:methylated-DNA-protein-cysteine methyltransferase-like protein
MTEVDERARRIVDVLMALRPGEVTTYGDIAEVAGLPGRSRLVNATGRLVPGHEREQAALLRAEDVSVRAGRVVTAPTGRFSRPARRTGRS